MYVGGRPGCCRAVQDAAEATAAAVGLTNSGVLPAAGSAAAVSLARETVPVLYGDAV
jgi:hypothetical protein